MSKKNWKVTQRSINQIEAEDFDINLTYNEARTMAKEYGECEKMYIYVAEKMESGK